MSKKILIWGGKDQSHILHQMIVDQNLGTPTIVYDSTLSSAQYATEATFCNEIAELSDLVLSTSHFAIGIGNEFGYARNLTASILCRLGLTPINITHPTSFQDKSSNLGVGLQLMPFSIIHKFCTIGDNVILNTNATIDHDCIIGNGVHVMGGATVAGRVRLHQFVTIGTNATILPNLSIGEGAFIGAGTVITRDIPPHSLVTGNPGKVVRKIKPEFFKSELEEFERLISKKNKPKNRQPQ